jgi:putative peptide zinc metalloprotease protein
LVVRIGSLEWEVLRRFDGSDLEHVLRRVERECGVRLALEELVRFAHQARDMGLLEQAGTQRTGRSRRRGVSWTLPLWNPERALTWCAPRMAILFHPLSLALGAVVIFIAAVRFVRVAASPAGTVSGWSQLLAFLVLLNFVSIVHEIGHALALHRNGGCVREIGVRFVLGWPCWYCDISGSYLLPRLRQRLAVLLAGPFFQAVACALVVLLTAGSSVSYLVALRTAAAMLGVFSALNFFPFVRSDGYYLLTELARIPNLRTHAWKWLSSSRARSRMRAEMPAVRRLVIAAYAIASFAFVLLVLGQAIAVVARVLAGSAHVSLRMVTATFSIIVILTTVIRARSFTP